MRARELFHVGLPNQVTLDIVALGESGVLAGEVERCPSASAAGHKVDLRLQVLAAFVARTARMPPSVLLLF